MTTETSSVYVVFFSRLGICNVPGMGLVVRADAPTRCSAISIVWVGRAVDNLRLRMRYLQRSRGRSVDTTVWHSLSPAGPDVDEFNGSGATPPYVCPPCVWIDDDARDVAADRKVLVDCSNSCRGSAYARAPYTCPVSVIHIYAKSLFGS